MTTRYTPPILMKPEGSLKICVLNGSRQIDIVEGNQWITLAIRPEAGLPRGIYQLADAKDPVQSRATETFSNAILHVGKNHVWQFSNDGEIVKHARSLFKGEPNVGHKYEISYEHGQAIAIDVAAQERARNRVPSTHASQALER